MSEINATVHHLAVALSDRYTIERELGAGGMATVYLAHDIRHDRSVAIKVLRSDIAQTIGADRFLREIQLAARLNHPNILARELHQGEPLSAYVTSIMGFCYSFGAHPDEGLEWAMRASPLDPTAFITLWSLQFAQYYARKYEASIATGDTLLAASGRHPWALLFSVLASVEYGDIPGARAIVAEMEARSAREYISPFHRGYAAALIGDEDAANRLLREAGARRDPGIPVFCRLAGEVPAMSKLPAYQELLRALSLPGPVVRRPRSAT